MNSYFSSLISPLSKPTLLALVEAFEATFDSSAWAKLGIELDMPQLGNSESRLQKALRFGDDDYGYQVAQFVNFMENNSPNELRQLATRPKLAEWLQQNYPKAAQELGLGQTHVPAPPALPSASEVVERALKDADHLLQTTGPVSALDRVHTALHGYLRDICARANLQVPANAGVGVLLKAVRSHHPKLVAMNQHDPQVDVVLGSLAGTVTALNTLRNNASVAHPNQVLLGEPEAMLMVNLVRTLFNYLEARL